MRSLVAILAVCCAPLSVAAPKPHAQVELIEMAGYISSPGTFDPFSSTDKEFVIGRSFGHGWDSQSCFATEEMYREIERHDGMAVVVRGFYVHRGGREWFLVEDLRLAKGKAR